MRRPDHDHSAPEPGVDRNQIVARLERVAEKGMSTRGVRHVAIGAAALDGSWEWTEAAGEASPDGRPMTADTPWLLASVTKLYIASVVLRLHEQGLIDLDTPIQTLLPPDLANGLHIRSGVDRTGDITIAHLLGHGSGLPDSLVEHEKGGSGLISDIEVSDRDFTFEEAVARSRSVQPHFAPTDLDGVRPKLRYSDTNYQLLMLICERVTGETMADLHRTLLFEPLQLRETWYPGDEPTDAATAWIGEWPLQNRPLALRSIGDLFATTADVLAFGRALFSGAVFEDTTTALHMSRRFSRFQLPRSVATIASPAWPIEYGLGMMRFAQPRALALARRNPALVGHTGATGSWLWLAPSLGVLFAGTVDQSTKAAFPFRMIPAALRGLDR